MAIEDILNTLDEQAQADCDAVIAEAREHAKLILDDAQRTADTIHDNFARQIERVAKSSASKLVNAARLEAKMEVSSAKGDGVASVFEAARGKLSSLRGADYDKLFDQLAAEALVGAGGEVTVHVAPEDVDRAQRAIASNGVSATVVGDLGAVGGLVVEAFGGRIVRRNTFEDRLDRVQQLVQAEVAKVLFS